MLELVIDQRRRSLGTFDVGRVLPFATHRMVGPFIFFDHIGPVDFPRGLAREADVRPHPHIGLSTVTYLFNGEIMHRDSVGSEQAIRPGEMNWMIAGRGITHSERFEHARAQGDHVHGIQAWVALPKQFEETEPGFAHYASEELPQLAERGVTMHLLAGEAFGARSGVPTHSPLFYLHWTLEPGASVELPAHYPQRAAYIAAGTISTGGERYRAGQMLVFSGRDAARLTAEAGAIVMGLGGEPVGERFIEWNFVSSSRERIEQAKADWRASRFALPVHDALERIPLPPESPPVTAAPPL
jgi:redox-sensitive bicupin YhaK (pirin superfamily)